MSGAPGIQYARSGGAHIAYQMLGDGPAIIITPGFASHLEREWEDAACRSFLRRLASFATVVRYDKRGTGLSDPVLTVPTLDQRDADLAAVIADSGVQGPVLFGFSEGGPIGIRFAAAHPGVLSALILYGTSARVPPDWAMEQLLAAAAVWGSGASIEHFARSRAADPQARAAQARFERESASPAMARALVESLRLVDVQDLLPTISLPTLILHRTDDMVPVSEGQFLAEHIASATLHELPGVDHRPWEGDSQGVIDEIERFLSSLQLPQPMRQAKPARRRPTRPLTGWASLTEREQDVVDLVASGFSNHEIAHRLFISRQTVQTHLKHLFDKLGIESRTALTAAAAQRPPRNP